MPNHHSFIPADHRYVSTSTSNKPQTPDISASPVASALQAAAHVVEWAAEELGIPEMAGKMKDSKEVEKEWRESPHKKIDEHQPSKSALAAAKLVGQGGGMAMHPPLAEGEQPEPSIAGQSTGRKNEFTLSNQETRDELKRMFDLTNTGEKGKEQAYEERRV